MPARCLRWFFEYFAREEDGVSGGEGEAESKRCQRCHGKVNRRRRGSNADGDEAAGCGPWNATVADART